MVYMVRQIAFLLCFWVFFFVGEVRAIEQPPLLDYGNVFTQEEKVILEKKLASMEENLGYAIGIVTYDEEIPSPLLSWVKREVGSLYFGEHRLIFAFNLRSREVVVEVNGKVETWVPVAKSDILIDQVTGSLTRGTYYAGSLSLLEQVENLFPSPQSQSPSSRGTSNTSGLLWISVSVGLLVAGGVTWGFIYSMNTVRQQDTAEGYFDSSQFRVTSEKERFLYRSVVSVPRQSQQRGSGGR